MLNTVLFDFDGTLIDTHELIAEGLNNISMMHRGVPFHAREHAGILGRPLETQLKMICPDGPDTMTSDFQKWYRENHDHYVRAYDDVLDMLHMLRMEGYKLGIVTNNSRQGLQLGLRSLGLEAFFDVLVTRDDVAECKPSPDGLLVALEYLKACPEEALYVGDSAGDIQAARSAGVIPVLVGWTTLSLEAVRVLSPEELVESPFEIPFLMSLMNTEIA